jgi:hypothetical protein
MRHVFAWGSLSKGNRHVKSSPPRQLPASYDWRGSRFAWEPECSAGADLALDVERLDTPLPADIMAQGLPVESFLRAWTRIEAIAKLRHEPVLACYLSESLVVPELGTPYVIRSSSGPPLHLLTGVWLEMQLVFTCGKRLL